MPEPLVVHAPKPGDDLGLLTPALVELFTAIRAGVLDGRSVVVVLDDADLLGQGSVADAAAATAGLGLVRAFALEGAREGWRVNAVSRRDGDESLEETVTLVASASAITGQLVRLGTRHIGRVVP